MNVQKIKQNRINKLERCLLNFGVKLPTDQFLGSRKHKIIWVLVSIIRCCGSGVSSPEYVFWATKFGCKYYCTWGVLRFPQSQLSSAVWRQHHIQIYLLSTHFLSYLFYPAFFQYSCSIYLQIMSICVFFILEISDVVSEGNHTRRFAECSICPRHQGKTLVQNKTLTLLQTHNPYFGLPKSAVYVYSLIFS